MNKRHRDRKDKEPIAIIGIGCRFPAKGNSPRAFWENLLHGIDAIIDVPSDRWDLNKYYDEDSDKKCKIHTKQGGYLQENIFEFDPLFFDISPRQAESIDPQQRLLLEVTYEAFEDAGLDIYKLKGSNTGVFIGGFTLDSYILAFNHYNRVLLDSHSAVNHTMTMLSNRISYCYDFKGPSISVDTACSSSLVSSYYACQSIWNGDCNIAVAGGVNIMLVPEFSIVLTKGRFISKHGRCKTFDRDASGYVRGEGAGVVILKPLKEAIDHNDTIYAVIRNCGINHDGRTNGITIPNGDSQFSLIKKVYDEIHIDVNQIHYIEAHGTGTIVGDTTELKTLNTLLQEKGNIQKCLVGSVKSCIGHLEAGAGVASLIKTALCLQNKKVPPNLHFDHPNENLDFENLSITVPVTIEDLPKESLSLAAINGFGYGGTNAHFVLQEYENINKNDNNPVNSFCTPFLFPFSAKDPQALYDLARRYHDFIVQEKPLLNDFLFSGIYRRSHHAHRAAIIAYNLDELKTSLNSFSLDHQDTYCVSHYANIDNTPQLVYVFTGMGPQWWGMGRELYRRFQVFRDKINECDTLFTHIAGWSILKEMEEDEADSKITETQIAQPANFLIQAALSTLLEYFGIKPDIIVGHSVGEVTAAYVSGALSLEDALKVSYFRSQAQQRKKGTGEMLAVGMGYKDCVKLCSSYSQVAVAAINSPLSVTLSGNAENLKRIAALLTEKKIFNRFLNVEIPYHSMYMDDILDELLESLKGITRQKIEIPTYSTVTGTLSENNEYNQNYWVDNVRKPVQFEAAINEICKKINAVFLEVGPHPVLRNSLNDCFSSTGTTHLHAATLNRKEPELHSFMKSLATLYTYGIAFDWSVFVSSGNYIKLPLYPWQRKHYWRESIFSLKDHRVNPGNPFVQTPVETAHPTWQIELNDSFFPFLKDHIVSNYIVFPGAGYIAGALQIHDAIFGSKNKALLRHFKFHKILTYNKKILKYLQISYDWLTHKFSAHSQVKEDENLPNWILHAEGILHSIPEQSINSYNINITTLLQRCKKEITGESVYKKLKNLGLEYGASFKCITKINLGDNELIARLTGKIKNELDDNEYLLHPTILDATFQCLVVFGDNEFIPVSMDKLSFYSSPQNNCYCHIKIISKNEHHVKGNISLFNENGDVHAIISGIECRRLLTAKSTDVDISHLFYTFKWYETPLKNNDMNTNQWIVFSRDTLYDRKCINLIYEHNKKCIVVKNGLEYKHVSDTEYIIYSENETDFRKLFTHLAGIKYELNILYFWSIDQNDQDICADNITNKLIPLVNLVKGLREKQQINLIIITRGAQHVVETDSIHALNASSLWGIGPLIKNEYPWIVIRMIDLENNNSKMNDEMSLLIKEAFTMNDEEDIAFRNNNRYVKYLQRILKEKDDSLDKEIVTSETPVNLRFNFTRQKNFAQFVKISKTLPEPDEVTVKLKSFSLHFNGTFGFEEFKKQRFFPPVECSGVIVDSVNEKEERRVLFYQNSENIRNYISINISLLLPYSNELTYNQSLLIFPFLKALYSLKCLASLKDGDSILITDATEASGLAAIQYAQWKNAEIFAVVDTPEKMDYLENIGIKNVVSYGDLVFNNTIMEKTNGTGLDIIFHNASNPKAFECIKYCARNARFINLTDIEDCNNLIIPTHLLLLENINFSKINIQKIITDEKRKTEVNDLLSLMYRGFREGFFHGIPFEIISPDNPDEICNKNSVNGIGISIVDLYSSHITIESQPTVFPASDKNVYIITGGTSGFGFVLAQFLVSRGVKKLALLSRSGIKDDKIIAEVKKMESDEVQIYAQPCDIIDKHQLETCLKYIRENMGIITGIFHGAAILDDGYFIDMTAERFNKVLKPKVEGACNLHELTIQDPVMFFMLFSSISSIIGNTGQANYIAANSFLDSFTFFRKSKNLPGITINLGTLKEVGILARNKDIAQLLENMGIISLTNNQALRAIETALQQNNKQIGIFDVDWNKFKDNFIGLRNSSRLSKLVTNDDSDKVQKREKLKTEFINKDEKFKITYLESLFVNELVEVLQLKPESINKQIGINHLGIDSLMVAELVRNVNYNTGLEISPMDLLSGPSVHQISRLMLNTLNKDR